MSEIDEIDLAIANLLMEDGRMECAEIARRIGSISDRAVRYRLNRMRKKGIIQIRAIPNPHAVHFPVAADVFVEIEPGQVMEVAKQMMEYDLVSYVACCTGENDMSLQVVARDNLELYRFVTEIVAKVPGVKKTTTLLIPMILKDVYEWRIPASVCRDANTSRTKTSGHQESDSPPARAKKGR
jgi:DNA-binding Lrp family transcriptional regulator